MSCLERESGEWTRREGRERAELEAELEAGGVGWECHWGQVGDPPEDALNLGAHLRRQTGLFLTPIPHNLPRCRTLASLRIRILLLNLSGPPVDAELPTSRSEQRDSSPPLSNLRQSTTPLNWFRFSSPRFTYRARHPVRTCRTSPPGEMNANVRSTSPLGSFPSPAPSLTSWAFLPPPPRPALTISRPAPPPPAPRHQYRASVACPVLPVLRTRPSHLPVTAPVRSSLPSLVLPHAPPPILCVTA